MRYKSFIRATTSKVLAVFLAELSWSLTQRKAEYPLLLIVILYRKLRVPGTISLWC